MHWSRKRRATGKTEEKSTFAKRRLLGKRPSAGLFENAEKEWDRRDSREWWGKNSFKDIGRKEERRLDLVPSIAGMKRGEKRGGANENLLLIKR